MSNDPESGKPGDIVARGALYFRMTRIGMLVLLAGIGAWFFYDGFYHWPAEVAPYKEAKLKPPHTDLDIFLNQMLGILLPPAGVAALALGLWQSRGEIRLSGNTLSVPGHEPIALDTIETIDKSRWDKKGIAIIEYHLSGGAKKAFKLDDYIYERSPIDEMFEIIEQAITEPTTEPVTYPRAAPTKSAPGRAPRVPTEKLPPVKPGQDVPQPMRMSPPSRVPPPPRTSAAPRTPPPTRLPPRPKRDV
jgi:hypothetical protein